MYQLILFCFILSIPLSFYYGGVVVGIVTTVLVGVASYLLYFFYKKNIEKKCQRIKEGKDEHFVDVNKDPWEVFAALPFYTNVAAKRVVYFRNKYGKYKSVEDFFERNGVEANIQQLLSKYIKL